MQLQRKVDKVHIDREWLLDRVSQLQVYEYYVQGIKIGPKVKSPLHTDRNPSLSLTEKDGTLIWTDWSLDKRGNCITLVQELYGINYDKALYKIAYDLQLIDKDGQDTRMPIVRNPDSVPATKKSTLLQCTARGWNSRDDEYWGQYGITRAELIAEDVHPVKDLYIQRVRQPISPDERIYVYRYPDDKMKVYMPDRQKGEKWKSTVPCSYVEGLEMLNGDPRVLITKSKKDRLVLSKIVPYPVLNVQNEGSSCFHEEFRKLLEGREVVISYDADDAGVQNCKKICDTWGYKYVNTPRYMLEKGVKDWSEWVSVCKGYEEAREFLRMKGVI